MNESFVKLVLYKDFKEVDTIITVKTDTALNQAICLAEEWKKKDIRRNAVRLSFEDSIQ